MASVTAIPFEAKADDDIIYIRFTDGGVTMTDAHSWVVPEVTFPVGAIKGEVLGFRIQPIYKNPAPGRRKIDLPPAVGMDGPACMDCGSMTQRTGACYTCVGCGSTTGCG
jgi:hypothetical protein